MSVWSFLPVVGPVLDAITQGIGMDSSAHYQRVNMRESARLQHDENVYWAQYNTPSNQMARLAQAGLNPNLVYGNGADAQFKGEVSPSGGMPHSNLQFGTDMMNLASMAQQIKNMKEQAKLVKAQSDVEKEKAEAQRLENRRMRAAIPEYQGWLDQKAAWDKHLNSVSERERNQAQALYYDAQRDFNMVNTNLTKEFGYQLKEEETYQASLQSSIMEMQKNNIPRQLQAEYDLTVRQAQDLSAHIANLKAMKLMYDSETDLNKMKQIEQLITNGIKALEFKMEDFNVNIDTSGWAQFWNKWIGTVTGNIGKIFTGGVRKSLNK